MILCVTANPALDRTLVVPGFTAGRIFRPDSLLVAAGGKGINVARALRTLGGEALCAGFLAGHSGRLLAELAEQEGLPGAWTWVDGESRACTILADPNAEATVINESGPTVTSADWERLAADVMRESARAEAVCFSGSLPPGSPPESFAQLVKTLREAGRTVWGDTSGKALAAALAVPGVYIKVNGDEAGDVLGRKIEDASSAADAAREIQARTGGVAVLTLGARGAVIAQEGQRWHAQPPTLKVVSAVGSGDSFLGGLALAFAQGYAPDEALRQAAAAGAANALSIGGGSFSRADFENVLAGTTARAL